MLDRRASKPVGTEAAPCHGGAVARPQSGGSCTRSLGTHRHIARDLVNSGGCTEPLIDKIGAAPEATGSRGRSLYQVGRRKMGATTETAPCDNTHAFASAEAKYSCLGV